jgi:hypothetical protein
MLSSLLDCGSWLMVETKQSYKVHSEKTSFWGKEVVGTGEGIKQVSVVPLDIEISFDERLHYGKLYPPAQAWTLEQTCSRAACIMFKRGRLNKRR